MRRHKRVLVEALVDFAGERRPQVEHVVKSLARLCESDHLRLRDPAEPTLARLATYVATLVTTRVHTHLYRTTPR